jgi:hypothetical protein
MPPLYPRGAVYIAFYVLDPYQGYVWSDSRVRVVSGDFLGGRVLDIIPGGGSLKTNSTAVLHASYKLAEGKHYVFDSRTNDYVLLAKKPKGYSLAALESPAVTERLDAIANQAQAALPGILDLTNRVNLVLSNIATMTAEAQMVLSNTRPMLSNIAVITANLKNPNGSLGNWAIPTNLNAQLLQTLASANITLTNASMTIAHTDTNVTSIATNLDQSLISLANITSNLNQQVQSNTNLVKSISDLIINADDMIEGLKHHWLFRSAFKNRDKEAEREKKAESRKTDFPPPPKAGKWR